MASRKRVVLGVAVGVSAVLLLPVAGFYGVYVLAALAALLRHPGEFPAMYWFAVAWAGVITALPVMVVFALVQRFRQAGSK